MKLGHPWWFHDSIEGITRFRRRVTETAGIYNTVGFIDDTRAFPSIPARHAMSEVRRVLANGDVEEVGEVRVRFNAALKRLIASIEIGVVGDMNRESNKPIWANFQKSKNETSNFG